MCGSIHMQLDKFIKELRSHSKINWEVYLVSFLYYHVITCSLLIDFWEILFLTNKKIRYEPFMIKQQHLLTFNKWCMGASCVLYIFLLLVSYLTNNLLSNVLKFFSLLLSVYISHESHCPDRNISAVCVTLCCFVSHRVSEQPWTFRSIPLIFCILGQACDCSTIHSLSFHVSVYGRSVWLSWLMGILCCCCCY